MSARLLDKIVLVTGASKGIGKALALGMAREGAHLLVNYHSDAVGRVSARWDLSTRNCERSSSRQPQSGEDVP